MRRCSQETSDTHCIEIRTLRSSDDDSALTTSFVADIEATNVLPPLRYRNSFPWRDKVRRNDLSRKTTVEGAFMRKSTTVAALVLGLAASGMAAKFKGFVEDQMCAGKLEMKGNSECAKK